MVSKKMKTITLYNKKKLEESSYSSDAHRAYSCHHERSRHVGI